MPQPFHQPHASKASKGYKAHIIPQIPLIKGVDDKGRDENKKGIRHIVGKRKPTESQLARKNPRHKHGRKGDDTLTKARQQVKYKEILIIKPHAKAKEREQARKNRADFVFAKKARQKPLHQRTDDDSDYG